MSFGPDTYPNRLQSVREEMERQNINALFLPPSADLYYLTGIPRPKPGPTETNAPGGWARGVLVTESRATYICPRLSSLMGLGAIEEKAWIDEVVIIEETHDLKQQAARVLSLADGWRVGIPDMAMAASVVNMAHLFPSVEFVSSRPVVGKLRRIKSPDEIELMREASAMVDRAFTDMLGQLREGMTEAEITREVEALMVSHGASGVSFGSGIMIRGPQAVHLNGSGGDRERPPKLQAGDTLSFDIGCVYQEYCSDFGRTVYFGQASTEARQIHALVMEAQAAGIAAMKAGYSTCAEVDRAARSVIEQAGYGNGFLHRLGHAIGIDVHESPFLTSIDDTVIEAGMTFTVEPSIFAPGVGYIRVEDIVAVTADGAESLNNITKEPIVI